MKRRQAVGLVAANVCGAFVPLRAQPQRQPRLGILGTFLPSHPVVAPLWAAFFAELAARTWNDGRNLVVEGRYNQGQPERDAALAAELVATRPDVIVVNNSGAVSATRSVTRSIPIVMVNVSHAVEVGFVSSLARPGGNLTGVTNQAGDMQGKFVELLRSVRPDLKRLGIFWSPGNLGSMMAFKDAEAVAASVGLQVLSWPVEQAADIDRALSAARRESVQAVVVHPTPAIGSSWRQILSWANENRVVTLGQAAWVREGFLMSYWANIPDLYRLAAGLVDRILRGAKPADLPVEQPTRFDLVINLKTAKALGLTIPRSMLLSADEVIE